MLDHVSRLQCCPGFGFTIQVRSRSPQPYYASQPSRADAKRNPDSFGVFGSRLSFKRSSEWLSRSRHRFKQFLTGKSRMEIRILDDNKQPIAGIGFTADQLGKLIEHLANFRAEMTPEVPKEFPAVGPYPVKGTTDYRFSVDPFSGTLLLSFRTLSFGWLTFPLPEEELARTNHSLSDAKARMAQPSADTKQ
jgi:hypothetical protein